MNRVVTASLGGTSDTVFELDDRTGGLGWLADGTLLVVAMTSRRVYRMTDSGPVLHTDLSQLASFHCNDMVVDGAGRAYVGNFGYDLHGGAAIAPAELIRISPEGKAEVAADDLIFPNGSVITEDGSTLIVAETLASRLTEFDVDESGNLSHCGRVDLASATPDGICLDAEGALWVASPDTGVVIRVNRRGQQLATVRAKGTPYACMLGGPERRTLFVTTSETDDPETALAERSGRVETLEVDVPGAGLP